MTETSQDEACRRHYYDIKVVNKVMGIPVVSDTVEEIEKVATSLSESQHVKGAKQFVGHGVKVFSEIPAVQDGIKIINDNSAINEVKKTVYPCMFKAVGQLDNLACGGVDTLTSALPALSHPTPELVQTTKETATGYVYLLQEYLASFAVSQMSIKVLDSSLSVAERSVKYLQPDKKCPGLICSTYTKIRRTRRSLRAVRRAGERKTRLETDKLAQTGLIGRLASYLHVNSVLSFVGLELRVSQPNSEASGVLGEASIAELKGDLSGYRSDEDPDFHPQSNDSSLSSVDESSSSDSSDSEDAEDEEGAEDVDVVDSKSAKIESPTKENL